MITHKGPLTTEEFMAWLKNGKDMLAVERPKGWACFLKVPTRDGIDYIFHQDGNQRPQSLLSRYANFRFTGFYKQDEQKLYCPNIPTYAVPDWKNDPTTTEQNLRLEFCKDVRKSIEDMVNNDRADLPKGLTGDGLKAATAGYGHDLMDRSVVQLLMDSVPLDDVKFSSDYNYTGDLCDVLLDYLQDRKGFADRTAAEYITLHKAEIMSVLTYANTVRERYAAILSDTDNPIHKMKQISDAVKSSGATTVRVTIEKNGAEVSIRTPAQNLIGYHRIYENCDISLADRNALMEAFGNASGYTVNDIRCITNGRNTLYEAQMPEVKQAETPAKGFTMTMGGM